MAASATIVETRNLTKTYTLGSQKIEAIRDLNISIRAGEFVGIMGKSGSGKSTLMHILGCLEKPTKGICLLDGQDVAQLSDQALSMMRATQLGFVFQSFNLIPQYTVLENVAMPFLYRKENRSLALERSRTAIARVGLSNRQEHKPSELSGGEMQRVAIARALVVEPLLILADEPTGNLDSETSRDIITLFHEINEQGATLIVVTHEKEIASHCQNIYFLEDGRISCTEEHQ
jgi:putative ABC transport system ATP-binding protein